MVSTETLFRKRLLTQKFGLYSTIISFLQIQRVLCLFEFSNDNSNTTIDENGLQLRQKIRHTNDTYGLLWVKTPSGLVGDDQNFFVT